MDYDVNEMVRERLMDTYLGSGAKGRKCAVEKKYNGKTRCAKYAPKKKRVCAKEYKTGPRAGKCRKYKTMVGGAKKKCSGQPPQLKKYCMIYRRLKKEHPNTPAPKLRMMAKQEYR